MRYGAIALKGDVRSTTETLGRTFPTAIADIKCTLHSPVLSGAGSDTSSENVMSPFANLWPDINWWGHYSAGSSEVAIKTFGVSVDDNCPLTTLRDISEGIQAWENRLVGWLSVLADGPMELIGDHHAEVSWEDLVASEESGRMYFGSSRTVSLPKVVTADQWVYALLQTGSNVDAPLYRVLLVEAERAIASSRWRSAVVDAAAATEVAISKALSQELSQWNPAPATEAILKRVRMLGPMVSFAREVGLVIPERIQADLIDMRNRVMHQGFPAGKEEAVEVCRLAREVIDGLLPFSQVGSCP
ncbi:hypothetical protein [Amycolatopsis sp. WGS_07]|uniref:hypothetical protein n=1 Tax=Amycolatopsis sp. WGS_07 TaxID=3076764 RepID=UPI003873021C